MLRAYVEAMEYFGALPGEPLQECIAAVRRADTYVGVIGMRYGSTDEAGISITQREYDEAYATKKSVQIYLIDEQRHVIAPMFVDTGDTAHKLKVFKELLQKRHVCVLFNSPQDLALKIGIGLIRRFVDEPDVQKVADKLSSRLPGLLIKSGYSVDLQPRVIDVTANLNQSIPHDLVFADSRMHTVVSAGHFAVAIANGSFDVFDDVLTFDPTFWPILIALVRKFGVDEAALAKEIRFASDPLKFRLLVTLAGRLPALESTEAICEVFLHRYAFQHQFNEMAAQIARPISDVVKESLLSMPIAAMSIVQRYLAKSREMGRWQQKRVFEDVLRKVEGRVA